MSTLDDHRKLQAAVRAGNLRPVYLLHGEEDFFIDRLSETIEELAVEEHARDFDRTILYARETDPGRVMDQCRRFPMMGARQLVVVRELQAWRIDLLEKLEPYLHDPVPTTVLLLCHRHKRVDGRRTLLRSVQKGGGAVLLSEKVREEKLPELLTAIAREQRRRLGANEARLLAAHLGSDLAKAVKEVEKLCLVSEDGGTITASLIQRYVGISKDFNVFELQKAIGTRDAAKAQRIARHFAGDPRDHPLPLTLGALNTWFTKLALVHEHKDKGQQELARVLGVPPFFLKDYLDHARNYSLRQLVAIQRHLRQADLRSKGLGGDGADHGEILRELLAKVMA